MFLECGGITVHRKEIHSGHNGSAWVKGGRSGVDRSVKYPARSRLSVLAAVLAVALASTCSAVAIGAAEAGAATLTPIPGSANFTGTVLAYRLRSFKRLASSMLVGVNPLILPANSNGALTSASTGPYAVSFTSNGTTSDTGSVTPVTPTGTFSTSYSPTPFPSGLNTVQIALTASSGDTVSFKGITVNGDTIPDQSVTGGIDVICVTGLSLQGFTIGGSFARSEDQSGDFNMVDIQVGTGSCSPNSGQTPEFPLPILAPLALVVVGGAVLIVRRRYDHLPPTGG